MSHSARPYPLARTMICSVLLALLAACGGGGDYDDVEAAADAPQSEGRATALSAVGGTAFAASTDGAPLMPAMPSIAETIGTELALGPTASAWLAGIPESPPPAPPLPAPPAGSRTFYVDSVLGNDQYNGLAASQDTVGSGAAGPWRTLARVMRSDLGPGDTLVLACGSQWNETLRLPANGTTQRPVIVTAPPAGCATAPAIDGSLTLQPQAWSRHAGSIYKASFNGVPLQLHSSGGAMNEAHHPNRGHLSADPTSPYLALAANGNAVRINGRLRSNRLTTGADLVLPRGIALSAGARIRVRTNSWVLDESRISRVQGTRLTLATPTTYAVTAQWGYFLLGSLWMLDSAGEWHHDASTRTLYAWMPDSASPSTTVRATVLPVGIDLEARQHVVVNGLTVRYVGTGIQMTRSKGIRVRNSVFADLAFKGADAAGSAQVVFESNTFMRTGSDAISGQDDTSSPSTGMSILDNVIRESGVRMQGEVVESLPMSSRAAIRSALTSVVRGNVIVNSGYIGIWASAGSIVENNSIYGACTVLDDCAGIYTSNANNNSQIRGNTVLYSRGAAAGKPATARYTQAQGIYLDESASGVQVEDNTVIDADYGIHVHVSDRNVIRGNRLYGNRKSQIWLQETRNRDNPAGDLYGNVIEDNQIAPTLPGALGMLLETRFGSTAQFGRFDRNRYYDRVGVVVAEGTATGQRRFTLSQWMQSRGVGSIQPVDTNAAGVSGTPFTSFRISGTNLVGNSGLLNNAEGWSHWNQTAPAGQMRRETCPAGICLRYVAAGSPGIVSSPTFSVKQGHWYRLTLDLSTEQDNQAVQLVVRRGGGGTNGYESLSNVGLGLTADRQWKRFSVVFQATKTVNAGDPVTGDLGARVDIQGIEVRRSVSLANVELVPVTPDEQALTSAAQVNFGRSSVLAECPFATTQPAMCSGLRHLSDGSQADGSQYLPPHSAVLLYAQSDSLIDSDKDGIADTSDSCPNTPSDETADAQGCPLVLR